MVLIGVNSAHLYQFVATIRQISVAKLLI